LVSSVVVGLIWTFVGAPVALGYGAVLAVAGAVLLVTLVTAPSERVIATG
jgi:hypothetical protein